MAAMTVSLLTGDAVAKASLRTDRALAQRLRTFLQEAAAHVLRAEETADDGTFPMPQSPAMRRRSARTRHMSEAAGG
jgi:hypothetical protein